MCLHQDKKTLWSIDSKIREKTKIGSPGTANWDRIFEFSHLIGLILPFQDIQVQFEGEDFP